MMTFNEFCKSCKEEIRNHLPEYYQDGTIELKTMTKNNGQAKVALFIHQQESEITPALYLEECYQEYRAGVPVELIYDNIAGSYTNAVEMKGGISKEKFQVFEQAKEQIGYRLINASLNKQSLGGRPHRIVNDLAVTYDVRMSSPDNQQVASAAISNEMLKSWGISQDQVEKIAYENTFEKNSMKLLSLTDVIMSLGGGEEKDLMGEEKLSSTEMYVISNEEKHYGAAAMLNPDLLADVQSKLDGDFYILPSSVHELLIVSKEMDISVEELADMVQSINATEVSLEDRLSDNVYEFQAEKGCVEIASKGIEKDREVAR